MLKKVPHVIVSIISYAACLLATASLFACQDDPKITDAKRVLSILDPLLQDAKPATERDLSALKNLKISDPLAKTVVTSCVDFFQAFRDADTHSLSAETKLKESEVRKRNGIAEDTPAREPAKELAKLDDAVIALEASQKALVRAQKTEGKCLNSAIKLRRRVAAYE